MIDFRFFLISIVAVFLALGIGIVMGSAVLEGPILEGLERRAAGVLDRNDALRDQVADLELSNGALEEFARTVEPTLLQGELAGEEIVLIEAEGTSGDLMDSIESMVEVADGEITTRIVLTDRFALSEETDATALSNALDTEFSDPADLRIAAGAQLGSRLGAASEERTIDLDGEIARAAAAETLQTLEDEGFVTVERTEGQPIVPLDGLFLISAGAAGRAPYDVAELVVPLAGRADVRGTQALIAEPSTSAWDVVTEAREDPRVSDRVSTVDNGETVPGRLSIALALSGERVVGHWGTDDGAEALVPSPSG